MKYTHELIPDRILNYLVVMSVQHIQPDAVPVCLIQRGLFHGIYESDSSRHPELINNPHPSTVLKFSHNERHRLMK